MRGILQRFTQLLVSLLRLSLAAVFFWAGLSKLQSPEAAQMAVYQYRLVSWEIAGVLSTVVPMLECCAGFGLLVPRLHLGGASLAISLLLLFCGVLTAALVRKLDISCGCFGTGDAHTPALRRLIEDVLLLGLCCVIWRDAAIRLRYFQTVPATPPSQTN
jgi:hypothetical protein